MIRFILAFMLISRVIADLVFSIVGLAGMYEKWFRWRKLLVEPSWRGARGKRHGD
jgi:hypothetical protein